MHILRRFMRIVEAAQALAVVGTKVLLGDELVARIEKIGIVAPGWCIRPLRGEVIFRENPNGRRSGFDNAAEAGDFARANPRLFTTPEPSVPEIDLHNIWGFWITDTGDICQVKNHEDFAEQELPEAKRIGNATEDALAAGWIRVMCPRRRSNGDFYLFSAAWRRTTVLARRALARLIETLPEHEVYHIQGRDYAVQREAIRAVSRNTAV